MKAMRFHEHGGPEVLKYEEADDPKPGIGEVLVRVRATGLNHLDIWVRKGLPGVKTPLPHIPGSDIVGEIAEVGPGVDRQRGERVMVIPGRSCGRCEACLSGEDNYCARYEVIGGYYLDGGYAEYVAVPEVNLYPMPPDLSYEEAAAIPLCFITAWHMLVTQAQVRAGDDVLVLGAGSGVGSAAIQIAKLMGARVFATAGSDDKLHKAQALGADVLINHAQQDFSQEVRKQTNGRGVDVVVEHVGKATWERSMRSLAPRGRLVTCGGTTGPVVEVNLLFLFSKQYVIAGAYLGTKREFYDLMRFVAQRRLRGVVDRVLPLAEAAEAHRVVERREQFGKVILRV
ncbi:MAG: zinc-binding dehydrogenase [Deltaproteobacteria bacterium]|nr:zinc-binding dehydrogenase [Deltaproteobacteria bacterium]